MDWMRIMMYDLSMHFFSGIEFLMGAGSAGYSAWLDRRVDHYTLQYHHAGAPINLVVDRRPPVVLKDSVAWLTFPGHRFQYGRRDGTTWTHYYIGFRGPRVRQYIRSGLYPLSLRPPVIPIQDPDWFHDSFSRVIASLAAGPSRLPWTVHGLEGLLLHLHESGRTPGRELRLREPVHALHESIRQDPRREWDFRAEAEKLGVSYAHFRRVFRQCTGTSPQQSVIESRMQRAAWLLRHTRMPVKIVAMETGMDDPYHFTRRFSAHFHMPPTRYREQFSY